MERASIWTKLSREMQIFNNFLIRYNMIIKSLQRQNTKKKKKTFEAVLWVVIQDKKKTQQIMVSVEHRITYWLLSVYLPVNSYMSVTW